GAMARAVAVHLAELARGGEAAAPAVEGAAAAPAGRGGAVADAVLVADAGRSAAIGAGVARRPGIGAVASAVARGAARGTGSHDLHGVIANEDVLATDLGARMGVGRDTIGEVRVEVGEHPLAGRQHPVAVEVDPSLGLPGVRQSVAVAVDGAGSEPAGCR